MKNKTPRLLHYTLLAATILTLTACEFRLTTHLTLNPNMTGTFTHKSLVDQELLQASGGDPFKHDIIQQQFNTGIWTAQPTETETHTGWEITGTYKTPAHLHNELQTLKQNDPDQGLPQYIYQMTPTRHTNLLGNNTYSLKINLNSLQQTRTQLSEATGLIEDGEGILQISSFQITAQLPGTPIQHNADHHNPQTETFTWELNLTDHNRTLIAVTQQPPQNRGPIIAATILAATILITALTLNHKNKNKPKPKPTTTHTQKGQTQPPNAPEPTTSNNPPTPPPR